MTAYALRDTFDQQGTVRLSFLFRMLLVAALTLIATAPIYWLPGVPLPIMTAIKNAAFVSAIGLAVLMSGTRFFHLKLAIPFVLAALLNFLAFQINGSAEYAAYQALIFLAPMAWVLTIRSLNREQAGILLRYLPLSLGLIAVATAYAFIAKFGIVPDLRPPLEGLRMAQHQISAFEQMTVASIGFNHGSTGWGVGAGMALVLLGSILVGRNRKWLGIAVLTLAVLAPAAMGGRGAALGAVAAFILAIVTIRQLGNIRLVLIFLSIAAPFILLEYLVSIGFVSERFFNIRLNADRFFLIDELTTGRLGTWIHAIESFARSPIVGVGVEESLSLRRTGAVVAIHNVWLRILSEGGLISFLPTMAIIVWCARLTWRIVEFRPLLVFAGTVSLLEPSVVFGSFGNQAALWTAIGISVRAANR